MEVSPACNSVSRLTRGPQHWSFCKWYRRLPLCSHLSIDQNTVAWSGSLLLDPGQSCEEACYCAESGTDVHQELVKLWYMMQFMLRKTMKISDKMGKDRRLRAKLCRETWKVSFALRALQLKPEEPDETILSPRMLTLLLASYLIISVSKYIIFFKCIYVLVFCLSFAITTCLTLKGRETHTHTNRRDGLMRDFQRTRLLFTLGHRAH